MEARSSTNAVSVTAYLSIACLPRSYPMRKAVTKITILTNGGSVELESQERSVAFRTKKRDSADGCEVFMDEASSTRVPELAFRNRTSRGAVARRTGLRPRLQPFARSLRIAGAQGG